MAIKLASVNRSAEPFDASPAGAAYEYWMYGLRILSDMRLPLLSLPATGATADDADCVFVRASPDREIPEADGPVIAGLACHQSCHGGRLVTTVSRGTQGTWFWNEAVGTCHVLPDARRVDVFVAPGFDEGALGLMLTGQVATFVLHKLGYPSLHASAVVTDGRAIVFVGFPGHGKSTIASAFMRQGAALLTDDVLPLRALDDCIVGLPSIPLMKLWPQTAEQTLAIHEELPNLTRAYTKKLLRLDGRFPFAQAPAPVRVVYVLNRYESVPGTGQPDVVVERLSSRDGIAALLIHTSNRAFLAPAENAALLPLYARLLRQASVRRLTYPTGFEQQDVVRERILADLAEA